jgi:hypothetical protein
LLLLIQLLEGCFLVIFVVLVNVDDVFFGSDLWDCIFLWFQLYSSRIQLSWCPGIRCLWRKNVRICFRSTILLPCALFFISAMFYDGFF